MVTFEDFLKLELKVGTVLEAGEIEGSEKLLKLMVDLGEDKPRQILAGVRKWYKPEDFIGKQVIVVANLAPKVMLGLESQGMILAASCDDSPVFLTPSKKVPPGSCIK